MNWRSFWLLDGYIWFIFLLVFILIWFLIFVYSIWINNKYSKIWSKLYIFFKIDNINLKKFLLHICFLSIIFLVISYIFIKLLEYDKIMELKNILVMQFISIILILLWFFLWIIPFFKWKIKVQEKYGWVIYFHKNPFLFIFYVSLIISVILLPSLLFFYYTWWIDNFINFFIWIINWNYLY